MIFTINLAKQRFVCEWGTDGMIFMCDNVYDVALWGNTVRNVALGLWLVGQPCSKQLEQQEMQQAWS